MVVKTPEQLEDAAIADAIRSIVAIKTRVEQRELQNRLTDAVNRKVTDARLKGRKVDVDKFIVEVAREVAATQGD
jgi:hypothetical protein